MITVGTKNEATRIAWLRKTLRQIPAGLRILDAGAGEQQFRRFCLHLNYVAQDFARYDGKGDGRGLQKESWDQTKLDIVSDITTIPEPDNSFDAVMCVEVFEHLPEPVLAIKEFSRLLKSNGTLILTAPFCSLTHFAPYHYCTGFNRYFYEKHLIDNEFTIEEIIENGNYFEYMAQEVRRISWVAEKYCQSQPTLFDRFCLHFFLNMLSRFSGLDDGSSEMLHFGCLVKATRQ